MGTVLLALAQGPSGFHKLKVVKRLRSELAADPHFLEMFLEEARISARLNHPNVVQTFDVGCDGIHHYLEMEYLEGQSFDVVMRRAARSGGIPLPLSLWVLHQTLEGLHYAHELKAADGKPLGIVHRDVSPHNVFITYDGAVKLLDFGIAKAADSQTDTRTGVVKGKATYMAPEQAARTKVDRRADVFAVGVMLWQALTGERLWGELEDTEIFARLRAGDIPSPRAVRPDVPLELEAACMKALSRDPNDRFATAEEMQGAIEAFLETTVSRTSSKALGRYVAELFEGRRRAVQAEIDAQIRAMDEERGRRGRAEVPALPTGEPQTRGDETGSSELSSAQTLAEKVAAREARDRSARKSTSGRTLAGLAVGALVVGGVALMAPRAWFGARGGPAPAVSTSVPPTAAVECTSHLACREKLGVPAVCRADRHTCSKLASEDCHAQLEPDDLDQPELVLVGSMFPLSGPNAETYGLDAARAVDLARRDFASVAHGLPPRKGQSSWRRLGVIECDDAIDPLRAARHLVDDLGVPAVIGFGKSEVVVELANQLFIPRGVLAVAALNRSSQITSLPHPKGSPRLVIRLAANASAAAVPVARFIDDVLEPKLHASTLPPSTGMRVALVRSDGVPSLAFGDALVGALRIGGKPVALGTDAYRERVFAGDAPPSDVELTRLVDELARFAPHVVVYLDEVFPATILPALERAWTTGPRPIYVTASAFGGEALYRFVGKDEERRKRFFAVDLPANTSANVRFVNRYNEVFPTSRALTPGTAAGMPYDALYLIAYATALSDLEAPTGVTLARTLPQLVSGETSFDVGPVRIFDVEQAAQASPIRLVGAGATLDLDLATGDSRPSFAVYCLKTDANGAAVDVMESGLVFDPRAAKLVGSASCR
jgi:ABC-type branched-subunit amino acid transport system substrate-binding protein